jgi:ATP-dependent RNA helicase SUPV3L1/SUV3
MWSRGNALGSAITALLGPTNTGKTHRAMLRMLEHDSGIIGLPLRLLAREVYDRIAAQIGSEHVALLTGEEKQIPRTPRYWVCTVEAMPRDLELDFLAVDEIQLIAHSERGHTFTDRLLHARGRKETWFMGADTVRPLLGQLLPTAKLEAHPRLSSLRCQDSAPLSALPGRSAVIAFSATQVYEIAERLRQRFGGAAVVLGALSPRTRNAQVALYQSGEVDHLVATDAIGMGLNLDVNHVAFAALRKFDGHETRDLTLAEIGQIAGRAGRHLNAGSFGPLAPLPDFPFPMARALEEHRFAPETRAIWRNSDLNFDSVADLIASLKQRPKHGALRLVESATDLNALLALAERPAIAQLAKGQARVELLWEVCQIPDYRNLLADAHAELLGEIFQHLVTRERLPSSWIEEHIERIDNTDGDLDALLTRIGFIRTWIYVANRTHWVHHPAALQARTRAIEDRLSDAVHERLVARFVERGSKKQRRARPRATSPAEKTDATSDALGANHPFHALQALRDRLAPQHQPAAPSNSLLREVCDAKDAALDLTADGAILFGTTRLARLAASSQLLRPRLALEVEEQGQAVRELEARLHRFVSERIASLIGQTTELDERLEAAGRGLVYQLRHGLGTIATQKVAALIATLTEPERELLRRNAIVLGRHFVFSRRASKGLSQDLRRTLLATHGVLPQQIPTFAPSRTSHSLQHKPTPQIVHACLRLGYPLLGELAVRVDVIERIASEIINEPNDGILSDTALARISQLLGCKRSQAAAALASLGYHAQSRDVRHRKRSARRRRRPGSSPAAA